MLNNPRTFLLESTCLADPYYSTALFGQAPKRAGWAPKFTQKLLQSGFGTKGILQEIIRKGSTDLLGGGCPLAGPTLNDGRLLAGMLTHMRQDAAHRTEPLGSAGAQTEEHHLLPIEVIIIKINVGDQLIYSSGWVVTSVVNPKKIYFGSGYDFLRIPSQWIHVYCIGDVRDGGQACAGGGDHVLYIV